MQHAIVNWSVNGVPFFPAVYYGNLASGATDTIVIGRYVPRIGMSDTIRVWVKMPNLKEDGYVADDSICREVFGCYGAVMSFRKQAAVAAGKMDASFFLFFEETEWYFRHNLAGFKTIFCPEAKVYHERSMTTVRYSPRKLFYSERNRLRTAIRLMPVADVLKLPVRGFFRYLNMAKGGVPGQSGDGKKLSKVSICGALAKAWLQALVMLPDELVVRKKYRRKFGDVGAKVSEILKTYPIE